MSKNEKRVKSATYIKATAKLEKEVERDLLVPDPESERAEALLKEKMEQQNGKNN